MNMDLREQLVRTIEGCGQTRYRISAETGIAESVLSRLVNGGGDPRLSTVQTLVDYFGLELRPIKRARKAATSTRKGA